MSTLVSDLIDQAFLDIGVIQPGETITSTMQTGAFLLLNQLVASLSTEGATVYTETMGAFSLTPGVTAYTLGVGGIFNTASRAQKITAWRAYYSTLLHRGGKPVSMAEFGAASTQTNGETTPIPMVVGADTAYPLINIRVFPPPSFTPGTLELTYWTPIPAFTSVGQVVALPNGFEAMLHFNLAVWLYPQYPREKGIPPELAANAQNTKASIVQQNTTTAQPAQ